MNGVNDVNEAEIAIFYVVLAKKFGQLYADIWKVVVNLSLRIKADRSKNRKTEDDSPQHAAIAVIARRQQENPADTWLFQVHSNRAKNKLVSRVSVSRVFKNAGDHWVYPSIHTLCVNHAVCPCIRMVCRLKK